MNRPANGRDTLQLRHPVDVVVLTWNDGPLLDEAVASALGSVGVDVRVWVIDNASEPPATVVADPRVRLYRNQKNLGVASGRNQGVRVGEATFVCLLDSDARLHPNTLGTLAAAVDDDPSIGLVGPVFDDQPPETTGGSAPKLLRMAARVTGRSGEEAGVPTLPSDRREVDYVSGACQVFRRQTFNLVGGFDEWYFHGPEDVDFCLRIREQGLRIQQVTSAGCAHTPRRRQAVSVHGLRNGVPVRWANSVLIGARSRVRSLSTRPAAVRRASRPTLRR
jgi:GT2 family glycosyltransferase